ncbi:1497_t:CDS:2 [Rhizophagus irregularis]|nr:1497_t:CDS:2 [Rhizophagus irregularis]
MRDNDVRLNPQEEDHRVKKFFKELSNKPQDFNPSPVTNIETENSTTPDIVFVELHNKILVAERILKEKTLKVSHMEYEILDSYYPLGEALEKKLAEFKSIHPGQPKKHSAKNIYNIFKTEGLGRDEIKQIRRISLLSFGKFTDKEIKIIQEKVRANSSRPNWLENQFNDLDLNRESVPMQTD